MKFSTGLKTFDRFAEISYVNSAFSRGVNYYKNLKEKNVILNSSFKVAEFSFQTIKFAATPIIPLIKNPGKIRINRNLTHFERILTVNFCALFLKLCRLILICAIR